MFGTKCRRFGRFEPLPLANWCCCRCQTKSRTSLCVQCPRCRDTSVCFQGIFARRGLRPCVVAAVQDCYWTVGRSVLVGNSMDLHPEKKWLAIDGRLRTVPKDNRSFGLFWSLTRTQVVTQQCHTLSCLQAVLATTSRLSNIDVQVSLGFFYFQSRYLHVSLVCTPLSRLICASQKHCTIRRVRLLARRTSC